MRHGSAAILRLGIKAEQTTSLRDITGGMLRSIAESRIDYGCQLINFMRGAKGHESHGEKVIDSHEEKVMDSHGQS